MPNMQFNLFKIIIIQDSFHILEGHLLIRIRLNPNTSYTFRKITIYSKGKIIDCNYTYMTIIK